MRKAICFVDVIAIRRTAEWQAVRFTMRLPRTMITLRIASILAFLIALETLPFIGTALARSLKPNCELKDAVVFEAHRTEKEFSQYLRGPYWTPTQCEISKIERELPKALNSTSEAKTEKVDYGKKLAEYRRQYFGYTEGDTKAVYVIGFCEFDSNWRTIPPVIVMDGGTCFFEGMFDLKSNSFTWLSFHGQA